MRDIPTERITLESGHPLHQLGELRTKLLDAIKTDTRVEIETGELTDAPIFLTQLLFAAHRTAREKRCELIIDCDEDGAISKALTSSGFMAAQPLAPVIVDGKWSGLIANEGSV